MSEIIGAPVLVSCDRRHDLVGWGGVEVRLGTVPVKA